MNHAPADTPETTIHPLDGCSRLLDRFERLALSAMTPHDQTKFFQVFARGLRLQAEHEPNALSWSRYISGCVDKDITGICKHELSKAQYGSLSQTLLDQPASFISPRHQEECLAFAAKVTLAICLDLVQAEPQTTCHLLKQLFKSPTSHWAMVRGPQLQTEHDTSLNRKGMKQVIQDFTNLTEQLKKVSIPPASHFLDKVPSELNPINLETPEVPNPVESASPKNPKAPKRPDEIEPDFLLFEAQILRSLHSDVSDGHRLPNNWNRLSNNELHPIVQKLRDQLRQSSENHCAVRVHAAARFISLFAGLSLKTCLTLPLARSTQNNRRGTMHLDLKCGVLRRNVLCIAERKKRNGKPRMNGRWWRVQIPPEIVGVLMHILEIHPNAQTLGDLVQAAGLDHESCQHLLNDGFPSSHKPEDARFSNSFRTCLLELGVHPALVARTSGDNSTTPPADHFYLSFSTHQIHGVMTLFCKWAGLVPPSKPTTDRLIGSPKLLNLEEFRGMVAHLNQVVLSERNKVTARSDIETVVNFHNLYTKAFALQLILAHGGRGNLIGRMTFERIFASCEYIALSDRRVDRYSRQRICPLTPLMFQCNGHYIEHISAFSLRLKAHAAVESADLADLARGQQRHKIPFSIFTKVDNGWGRRDLKRNDLLQLLQLLGRTIGKSFDWEDLNVSRHFWHTELVNRNIAQPAIEAFLGHHTNGVEVFGYGSGVSIRDTCEYLRPTLHNIQSDLGLKPLIGLGRTADRYLKLPELSAPRNLRPLPSKLLLQKLQQQDLLIPEMTIREQDPPTTSKTLVTHASVGRLKSQYLQSDLAATHSVGAVMFCLMVFDLVLSEPEQHALFGAAINDGLWAVGDMCIVEAEHVSRPIAQRILQEPTQAAIAKAREKHVFGASAGLDMGTVANDLHLLLASLSPTWPCKTAEASLKLLPIMVSHWAAIEIAPGTLFGVFHKAPFIPVKDLARLYYKQPRAHSEKAAETENSKHRSPKPNFRDTDTILQTWANKDAPLGESPSRAVGCTKALNHYLQRGDLNLAERLHAELLIADLSSTPPYRTLDTSTLPTYSNKYQRFFAILQVEDTCDLEPEHFLQAYRDMGGHDDMSASALPRWAMLHICAFLSLRGHWVPAALTANPATKTPRPPRIPVYTSMQEVEAAGLDLVEYFKNYGGTYAFARPRLELERHAPLRAAELRYSRPHDFDLDNDLLHITTSGHDHLKNTYSRGTIPITRDISRGMLGLKKTKRDIDIGTDTLMFADAHLGASYGSFNEVTSAIRKFVILQTNCPEFRRHDFRSSAITDTCFDVQSEISRLGPIDRFGENCLHRSVDQINERFTRFARAARFGRHASIATTLRFYNCSGPLDLHQQLEYSTRNLPVSGVYAAALLGMSAQNLYVRKDRRNDRRSEYPLSPAVDNKVMVAEKLRAYRNELSTPALLGPTNCTSSQTSLAIPRTSAVLIVQACLLAAAGMSIESAAAALNLPVEPAQNAFLDAQKVMALHVTSVESRDSTPTLSSLLTPGSTPPPLGAAIKSLSRWLSKTAESKPHWSLPLRLALKLSGSASTLRIADEKHLTELLPMFKGVATHGFRVFLRPTNGVIISASPNLAQTLKVAGIEVHSGRGKSNGYGSVQFSMRPAINREVSGSGEANTLATPDEISPRSLGMAGRVVVLGLVIATFTDL